MGYIKFYIISQLILYAIYLTGFLFGFYRYQKRYRATTSIVDFLTNPKYYFALFYNYEYVYDYKKKYKKNDKKKGNARVVNTELNLIRYKDDKGEPLTLILFSLMSLPLMRFIMLFTIVSEIGKDSMQEYEIIKKDLNQTLCCTKCNVYTRKAYMNAYIKKHDLDYDTNVCPTCEERDTLKVKALPSTIGKFDTQDCLEDAPYLYTDKELASCTFVEGNERHTFKELKKMYLIMKKEESLQPKKEKVIPKTPVELFKEEQQRLFLEQREKDLKNKTKKENVNV